MHIPLSPDPFLTPEQADRPAAVEPHSIGREILCSLPRSFACRVCIGSTDCDFLAWRSPTRVYVQRRPEKVIDPEHRPVRLTGMRGSTAPLHQRLLAVIGWMAVGLSAATAVEHFHAFAVILVVNAIAFVGTTVGVPITRRRMWDDPTSRGEAEDPPECGRLGQVAA